MKSFTTALVQTDVSVGALHANAEKIVRLAHEAVGRGARLVVFPELAVSGYPPEDLVLKRHFLADCRQILALLRSQLPKEAVVVVGTPLLLQGRARNAAAIFAGGRLLGCYSKMLLPNYGVFDEKRVFAPGSNPMVLEWGGLRIGLHICEDSWDLTGLPCRALRAAGVDLVLNLSASPYHRGKAKLRQQVMGRAARFIRAPLLYCNLVGGQDELVFDGTSMAFGAGGQLIARAQPFADDLLLVRVPMTGRKRTRSSKDWSVKTLKIPLPPPAEAPASKGNAGNTVAPLPEDLAEVYAALKLGLRDYMDKNGFRQAVVALSGGIDSALVAAIAVDALGAGRVVGVTMPSQYSSRETLADARLIAHNLRIDLHEVPIKRLHDAYLGELSKLWPDHGPDTTEENLQARIRGNIVMALSNKFGWLVLTTGNKSELATGYCTLYGDMAGGFALIKDVPKTLVWELARWRNRQGGEPPIPPATIERPPSAELRPDQRDTDSLPPYDVLDPILERYVERDEGWAKIVAAGFDGASVRRVIRLVDVNEYKRRQGAPGIKITPKAFGRDRRLPITNLYREHGAKGSPS